MRSNDHPFLLGDVAPPRVALSLACADGTRWTVTMSAGVERFIGAYPRICGMIAAGPLLEFEPAYPST
jgi:hypothetical protein